MTMPVPAIERAREDARRARARLADDLSLLQRRASPGVLVADAAGTAKTKATDAAGDAVAFAKSRPIVAVGGAVALGLLITRAPLRKAAIAAGSLAWRNRSLIGRLLGSKPRSRAPANREGGSRS